MYRQMCGLFGLLPSLCLLGGCGGAFSPVKGELVFPDGSPVTGMEGARIVFEATGSDGKEYSSVGTVDAEGHFELTTNKTGDGAPVGKNRVLIERKMLDSERMAPRVIAAKYEKFETSGLEYEVISGKNYAKFTVEAVKKTAGK